MSSLTRTVGLGLTHAKYNLLETSRVPIAIIGSVVFPALAFTFFVVPQRTVADNPDFATQAVISMSFFAVFANALFGFGLSIAEEREKPWQPYLRSLPAPAASQVIGLVLGNGALAFVAVLPVLVIGGLFTEATASFAAILLGFAALVGAALPFMFLGISIGYSMSAKAAVAVIQVLMFGLAFAGGLFLPPQLFPDWLEIATRFIPTRQAREFVIWAVQGGTLEPWIWLGLVAWTVALLGLALILIRRDEGRRYA
ncbi:ABC transporter permease [Lysinibacter cavernae]|uniref:ABC-2 type transport system permease protein n=1 Tax=Lysinibacter cavernae TaxID=1640652 RepID=A0A7X5TRS9_9MICO|nr:ABC transporter permease [Lysinibacter cavernae]NIH52626.1 ABC-2 type transport system permease protein [Lysinibacter cavernae]